jgi:hypothetical protein
MDAVAAGAAAASSSLTFPCQIMSSLTKFSRRALMDRFDPAVRIRSPVYPPVPGVSSSSMCLSLTRLMEDLVFKERVLGMQVCVVQGSAVLADVAAGSMGLLDPRPVTPSTLFPCVGVSRLGPIAIVSALADANMLGTSCVAQGEYPQVSLPWLLVRGPSYVGVG